MGTTAGIFQACCPTNAFGETVHEKTVCLGVCSWNGNTNLLTEAANSINGFVLGHSRGPQPGLGGWLAACAAIYSFRACTFRVGTDDRGLVNIFTGSEWKRSTPSVTLTDWTRWSIGPSNCNFAPEHLLANMHIDYLLCVLVSRWCLCPERQTSTETAKLLFSYD